MNRLVAALLLLGLLLVGVAPAQDKDKDKIKDKVQEKEKDQDKVRLYWHGQSFFRILTPKGTRVLIDPHDIPGYGRVLGLKADLVLMSHNHNDHTQLVVIENIKDKTSPPQVIPGWVKKGKRDDWNLLTTTFKDVKLRTVGVYHDDMEGFKYGKNTVFILEIDGWRIVHLGDLGHLLSDEQVQQIKKDGPIDVLMIPVGGIYSLNGREAKKVVKQLQPREYIIPMHFGTAVFDDLLPVSEFLEGQPRESVLRAKDNRLVLDRDDQRARPQTVVLHWWSKGKQ
jgi:L-ascorbate metabolism protein UlaG (beta-lactamase superfamily)